MRFDFYHFLFALSEKEKIYTTKEISTHCYKVKSDYKVSAKKNVSFINATYMIYGFLLIRV